MTDSSLVNAAIADIPINLKCTEDKKISSIIDRFSSSHLPLFVYNSEQEFLGLLTAGNTLFKRRNNPSTVISSCLMSPPQLTAHTPIPEIFRMMIEHGLYILPVFNDTQKIIGVVDAKNILRDLKKDQTFLDKLASKLSHGQVMTIAKDSTVGKAYQLFTQKDVSKLIVINSDGRVAGLLSLKDILTLYLSPTPRQRFSSHANPKGHSYDSFDAEQLNRADQPISQVFTSNVKAYSHAIDANSVIQKLLDSKYYSVILIDEESHPVSIVTMEDVLQDAINIMASVLQTPIIISKLPEGLNESEKRRVLKNMQNLSQWINRQEKVQSVKFVSQSVFSPEGNLEQFNTRLKVMTDASNYNAGHKDRDFFQSLDETIRQIKKQVRRNH